MSSIRRCGNGTILRRGQGNDLGYARGRGAGQAHRQTPRQAELLTAQVHCRPRWRRPTPRERCELRLSLVEREEISRGLAAGDSIRAIAEALGRSPSTVCLEVNANGGRTKYRALVADRAAARRALRPKRAKLAECRRLGRIVERKLEAKWSPQQISAWLASQYPERPEMQVSHETIYQSLFVQSRGALRKELHSCLRSGRAMRRAKAYVNANHIGQGKLKNMVMISERPAEVMDRAVPATGKAISSSARR